MHMSRCHMNYLRALAGKQQPVRAVRRDYLILLNNKISGGLSEGSAGASARCLLVQLSGGGSGQKLTSAAARLLLDCRQGPTSCCDRCRSSCQDLGLSVASGFSAPQATSRSRFLEGSCHESCCWPAWP